MPMGEFPAYNRMRQEKDGIFWFIEYVTRGRAATIRGDGWKYFYSTGDGEELYDLKSDPMEMKNLADAPEYSAKLAELKNRLMEWLLREPVLRRKPVSCQE
jgi:arylsulfatase A-like enzyme